MSEIQAIKFNREDRYLVLKRRDLAEIGITEHEREVLDELQHRVREARKRRGAEPDMLCVVVEKDWPEYEAVWRMIEERCVVGIR